MKLCPTCKETKPLDSFRNKQANKDGKHGQCRDCMNVYNKRYHKTQKFITCRARRRKLELLLPSNISKKQIQDMRKQACSVSNESANIQPDHFIPLSVGHGGNYIGNIYPLSEALNENKGIKNPLIYFEFQLIQNNNSINSDKYDSLINKLSFNNCLMQSEFRQYVDWCYAHPRTIEQIESDNARYGYIVSSLELWRNATSLQFPLPRF